MIGVLSMKVDNSFLIFFEGWRCQVSCRMNNSKVSPFRVSLCLQTTLIDFHLAIRIFIYFESCKFRQSKNGPFHPMTLLEGISLILADLEYGNGESVGEIYRNDWFVMFEDMPVFVIDLSWARIQQIYRLQQLVINPSSAWIWNFSSTKVVLGTANNPIGRFYYLSFQSLQEEVQPYLNHWLRFKIISLVGLDTDAYSPHLQFFYIFRTKTGVLKRRSHLSDYEAREFCWRGVLGDYRENRCTCSDENFGAALV